MIRHSVLLCLLLFIGSTASAQQAGSPAAVDTFVTRYRLAKGTVLNYHLKVVRKPSRSIHGKVREMGDSVEVDVLAEVVDVDSSGVMMLNTELSNLQHGWYGDVQDFDLKYLPLPPRGYMEIAPSGVCKFGAVIEEDSARVATKVLSRTPAGHFAHALKDVEDVRRFAEYLFPSYGALPRHHDGEIVVDSSQNSFSADFEHVRRVAGQADPMVKANLEKGHQLMYDTTTWTGPGNFNGIPVFEIEHKRSYSGAAHEKYAGGHTGQYHEDELQELRKSYYRIDDGALVARDIRIQGRQGVSLIDTWIHVRLKPSSSR
jgi:hypothetical protein